MQESTARARLDEVQYFQHYKLGKKRELRKILRIELHLAQDISCTQSKEGEPAGELQNRRLEL